MRRVGGNETKRDETISLTVAAFNVGTVRGGGVEDRERGGTDGRQTGAISRLDLPLILSVKSCNACACMQYTHTHTKTLSHTHTCMHKQCICVGVKFFNYFCGLNCISCKGTRQTHEERERERETTKYADFISDWQLSLLRAGTDRDTLRRKGTDGGGRVCGRRKQADSREISCGALH